MNFPVFDIAAAANATAVDISRYNLPIIYLERNYDFILEKSAVNC